MFEEIRWPEVVQNRIDALFSSHGVLFIHHQSFCCTCRFGGTRGYHWYPIWWDSKNKAQEILFLKFLVERVIHVPEFGSKRYSAAVGFSPVHWGVSRVSLPWWASEPRDRIVLMHLDMISDVLWARSNPASISLLQRNNFNLHIKFCVLVCIINSEINFE